MTRSEISNLLGSIIQFLPTYSNHSPQTSQIQKVEEGSTQTCVGVIPQGPHTLHRDKMTPPPPPLLLDCTVLYYTLLYIGVLRVYVAINISIRYGSECVTFLVPPRISDLTLHVFLAYIQQSVVQHSVVQQWRRRSHLVPVQSVRSLGNCSYTLTSRCLIQKLDLRGLRRINWTMQQLQNSNRSQTTVEL